MQVHYNGFAVASQIVVPAFHADDDLQRHTSTSSGLPKRGVGGRAAHWTVPIVLRRRPSCNPKYRFSAELSLQSSQGSKSISIASITGRKKASTFPRAGCPL
jgi:hypothetical protein